MVDSDMEFQPKLVDHSFTPTTQDIPTVRPKIEKPGIVKRIRNRIKESRKITTNANTYDDFHTDGELNIHRKERSGVVEMSVGRILNLPTHILLWTPRAAFKDVSAETAQKLQEAYKNTPFQGKVDVYLNHSPLFKQMKRLFNSDRRMNVIPRVLLGIPYTAATWFLGKINRTDLYNPFTESAQVYHARSEIGIHEAGHAKDFDSGKFPFLKIAANLIPGVGIYREWKASHIAMRHIAPEDRQTAAKVLEPAWGSHISIPIGALAGHAHSRLSNQNVFFNESLGPQPAIVQNEVKKVA